ncbi:2Fe-2S iron-sulfur cluster-binding protein [Terricaulis sp.]|uniref:2Fe-2S iron-sulfur cluster-binding protein n=1 Tax=Terricaulis sp. TaxID=2768686 RepID=UPI003782D689
MPIIHVKLRSGEQRTIDARANQSVMEALRDNGVSEIEAMCGGCCSCATCHVFVDAAFTDRTPPITETESELLSMSDHRRDTSRLSCQIPLTADLDGLVVEVAPLD